MSSIVLLFLLCFICLLWLVRSQPSGFNKDGSIQQVLFAQQAVNRVDDHHVFAVKYQSCTIITSISKTKPFLSKLRTQSESFTDDVPVYKNSRLCCYLVGNKADSQQGRTLCGDLDSICRSNEGRHISAPRLALQLADEFQRYSMGSNPFRRLAINALIVNTDTDTTHNANNFGDIHIVDTSGSFACVKAGCIGGSQADRVNSWLSRRGRYLAARRLQKYALSCSDQSAESTLGSTTISIEGHHADSSMLKNDSNKNLTVVADAASTARISAVQQEGDSSNSSIAGCFNITASCLLENFSHDALGEGNYTVRVAVLSDRPRTDSQSPLIAKCCTVAVPVHILRKLVASQGVSRDSDIDSVGNAGESSGLAEWWQQQLHAAGSGCSRDGGAISSEGTVRSQSASADCGNTTILPIWKVIPS